MKATERRDYLSPEHQWVGEVMSADCSVPCGTCSACCRSVVDIKPERGDDPRQYDCVLNVDTSSANGLATIGLRRVPDANGDLVCVYLDAGGKCTIYDRRPHICRTFDCRKLHAILTRKEERQLVEHGYFESVVFEAARARRRTLPEFSRLRALGRRLGLGKMMFPFMQARRGFTS